MNSLKTLGRQSFILLALLAPLFLTSCSSHRRDVVDPSVSLVDLRVADVTVFETVMNVKVRVENENPFPLSFEGAVHRLTLNDMNVGKAFDEQGFTVPRLGSTTETVQIHLNNLALATRLRSLIENQRFDYELDSTLYMKDRRGRKRINVSKDGRFDFTELYPVPPNSRRPLPRRNPRY